MNLEFLKQLVEIDSQTHLIDGVNQVQKILLGNLASLDFDVKLIKGDQDKTGDLLWAQRKGITPKAITLVCHADTVLGPASDFNFNIDFSKSRAYGPGIGDNKGGIALLLGSLKDFLENVKNHFYTLNFVCSPNEETGSIGFHEIFKKIGDESEFVFGFEPALNNGDIISERAGNRWYQVFINGKSGHAGRWNEPTINAAHVASNFVSEIQKISNFENKRRVNVASLNGGVSKYNVVCGEMEIKIDTRFKDFTSRDLIHETIVDTLAKTQVFDHINDFKSEYHFKIIDDCPPMAQTESSKEFALKFLEKIKMYEGKKVNDAYSGGAADVNYFQRPGLISIDGLGPIAANMHTKEEYIDIESFYSRRNIFTEILMDLNQPYREEANGSIKNQPRSFEFNR